MRVGSPGTLRQVVTCRDRGAHGGRTWTADDGWHRYDPVDVPSLVDPRGAGDSCNAGVLMGNVAGVGILDACARGTAVSAHCLTQSGSFPLRPA